MSEYNFFLYSKLVSITANVLVLAATTVGMYQASLRPDEGLWVFCSWFFSLLPAVLLMAWAGHKYLQKRYGMPISDKIESIAN